MRWACLWVSLPAFMGRQSELDDDRPILETGHAAPSDPIGCLDRIY